MSSGLHVESACFRGGFKGAKSVRNLIGWSRAARVSGFYDGAQEVGGDCCQNEEAEDAQSGYTCEKYGLTSAQYACRHWT